MVGGRPDKVTKVLEETYYNTTSTCRIEERYMTAAPAETERERRGRNFANKLREAVRKYDSNATFFVGNKGDAWLEGCSDLAAELVPHELTDEDVERAVEAYLAWWATQVPTHGYSDLAKQNSNKAMRAALTAIGVLPAKREATEDEVERLAEAICHDAGLQKVREQQRSAARAAIAAMSPHEPLTASTISNADLKWAIRKILQNPPERSGIDNDLWMRAVRYARELLCKNAVIDEVDFVATTSGIGGAKLIPQNERAAKRCATMGATQRDINGLPYGTVSMISSAVQMLQHEGYTILVR